MNATGKFDLTEAIARHFWRSTNLIERIVMGPLTPQVYAPREIVYQWGKERLYRYEAVGKVRPTPVLIVPPLGVRPTIFDLRPGHSLIGRLVEAGLDVFLLDLGVPDKEELQKSVLDYATTTMPRTVKRVRQIAGDRDVSLVGWSLGGVFNYLYAAWGKRDKYVANLVTLGSPVDFARMFPFNIMAKLGQGVLDAFIDTIGNLPPILLNNGFKMISPMGSLTRTINLAFNYWDREYVAGYETISQWSGGFLPYPAESFRQFAVDFMASDKLKLGDLAVDGIQINLKNIDCPILAFAGTADKITPPDSVNAIDRLTSSGDVTAAHVPLGHIGLVAGSQAPQYVWGPMADWLLARSG